MMIAVFCSSAIFAQESLRSKLLTGTHHVYADMGTKSTISLTYNYNVSRHWGWGAGVQRGKWDNGYAINQHYISSIFADMHFSMRPKKNNQFFSNLDFGMDLYKHDKRYYLDSVILYDFSGKSSLYTALGFGYMRRITKRGGGIYVSLRFVFDMYKVNIYSYIADDKNTTTKWANGNGILSIGFKF